MIRKILKILAITFLEIIFLGLLSFSFYELVDKNSAAVLWKNLLFCALFIFYLLFSTGIIGPKRWKVIMKSYLKWSWNDSKLVFPIDPTIGLSQAIKNTIENPFPIRAHAKDFAIKLAIGLIICIISVWLWGIYRAA